MKEYEELNLLITSRSNNLIVTQAAMDSDYQRLKWNSLVLLISMASLLAFPDFILMAIFATASVLVLISFQRYSTKVISHEKAQRMVELLISERDELARVLAEEE